MGFIFRVSHLNNFYHHYIILGCRFEGIPNLIAKDEGNLVRPKKEKMSLADCLDYCEETHGCNSFSFSDNMKACWLRDKVLMGKLENTDGLTSFFRSCDMGNNDQN